MKYLFQFVIALICSVTLLAQNTGEMPAIPAMRQLHHQYILDSQKKIDLFFATSDRIGKLDKQSADSIILITRIEIETNKFFTESDKFKWLRSTNEILTGFISAYRSRLVLLNDLNPTLLAFRKAMHLELAIQTIYPVFEENKLAICNILIDNFGLSNNSGISKSRDLIIWKYCQIHPDQILPLLSKNANNEFADSLIIQAAFHDPEKLYNYAAAPNALGKKIQSENHLLVQIIRQLSVTKTGRMYVPFLDQLYHGTITIDAIKPLLLEENAEKYYQLLVATRIEYVKRMQRGDTALLVNVLTDKLKYKAVELYINDINALHELKDLKVRFKKLDSLSAQELYYLAVMGEEEMYTSSFVSGIYPRIFQKMQKPNSDSLLLSVCDDYFKKFIKISATYNTLDDLLKRMDSVAAEKRIRSFVDGLAHSKNLEDAVDVADSYASIYQPALRTLILQEVQKELTSNTKASNSRGIKMYQLLQHIFLSLDTANHIDLTAKLGIPSVYFMPLKRLQDSSGRVVMQQFFYGDKDGTNIFNAFVAGFQNGKWKIVMKPEWVEISSKSGTPITIFANRPLDAATDQDEQAQNNLINYLEELHLPPTVVIHRGHSYHLPSTIDKLTPSAQLIILGSCGGYQNLNAVLSICQDAQIVSTKQVGTGVINKALISEISEKLRLKQDLNWPELWNDLAKQITPNLKETFEDYVPPHKNLGAIFIMAFNRN